MGKQSAPPPPDYSGIAAASSEQAHLQFQLGQDQLAWAKDQYASDRETTDKVVDAALKTQADNSAAAKQDRARYEQTYQPLENDLVHDAASYATNERQEADAGKAQANVSQQFDQARDQAQQRLESFGVDPSQTRAQALDVSVRTQEAAARASAGNQARVQDQSIGRALRSEALNIGKGYPGQIAQTYGTAIQAGNQAVNSGLATTATGAQTMGTPTQYMAGSNNALGTWSNALTAGYNAQMQQYNANQKSSSGLGSILGLGAGLLTMFEDGGPVPENGEPAPAPQQTALPVHQHNGVPVPVSASPSGGAQTDDVPARLNAGEFVLPKDVVAWKGQEFFQKLIDQSRKQHDGASAQPRVQALPPRAAAQAPAVQTALPTG